jgi:serine/threonine-protein kinase
MTSQDPKTIGRYKVIQKLGAGAMGAVYLCMDPLLKRKVAVKIVLNTRTDAEIMALRFQRESEISAQLNHPHIVTVFDIGTDELVGPFLTMEYIDGCSMAHLLRTAPPDARTAIDWLCQLGQAMAAAEQSGVVHRDIKPENILVDKQGRLKLSDFGLARNEEGSLTTTGVIMGTPCYTAPELLKGGQANFATDRWALAVTAFQTVTGNRLPFRSGSISTLLHHIANEPPEIPEDMPAPVSRVFLKAMHRDPSRRYGSIAAFLEALAHALGVTDALDLRGLTPASKEASPSADSVQETQSLPPSKASPVPAPPAPKDTHSSPLPGAHRLTGPPKELLKGGADAGSPSPTNPFDGNEVTQGMPQLPVSHTPRAKPVPTVTRADNTVKPLVIALGIAAAVGGYLLYLHPWSVRFDSSPPGAEVYVDNAYVGKTPVEGGMRFGEHSARVELEGFESEGRNFKTSEGSLSFTLKTKLAWTDIVTQPVGAEVYLGGRHLGPSPVSGVLIPNPPEQLVIRLKGYQTWEGLLGPSNPLPASIPLRPE